MQDNGEKGRVGIVLAQAQFDSIPSLVNTATLLSKAGYAVDIFAKVSGRFVTPTFESENITLRVLGVEGFGNYFAGNSDHQSMLEKIRRTGPLHKVLRGGYRAFKKTTTALSATKSSILNSARVWRLHRTRPFLCIIGVEPEGLVAADSFTRFINVPLVYYSLELLLSNELTPGDTKLKKLKMKEMKLSQQAVMTVIQDKDRADILRADNRIPLEKFVMVPNSPLGPARRKPSGYWHKKFDFPSEYRVVLHAGNAGDWTNIDEIIKSSVSWPDNWVLVVHTRFNAETTEGDQLRALAPPGRVFFSFNAVPNDEYEALVDGADIGIAFYVPQPGSRYSQQNLETIGLSSGKLAYYLRAGLPVIVNDIKPMGEIVADERCGVCVAGADEIGPAIASISRDYDDRSRQAIKVFEERLDFSRSFQEVIKRMGALQ